MAGIQAVVFDACGALRDVHAAMAHVAARVRPDSRIGPDWVVSFVSSNPWDTSGTAGFGVRRAWLNRTSQPAACNLPRRATEAATSISLANPLS